MKKIEVISIPVADQQVAKAFYADKLGFQIIAEVPMGNGQTWVQLGRAGGETSITLVTWLPKMPPGSVQGLVIGTDDIATDVADLQQKGVNMTKIDPTPWGKFSSFQDIDGNGWILREGN